MQEIVPEISKYHADGIPPAVPHETCLPASDANQEFHYRDQRGMRNEQQLPLQKDPGRDRYDAARVSAGILPQSDRTKIKGISNHQGGRKFLLLHLVDSVLHVFGALAVLHGRGCLSSAEHLREVAQGGESQQLSNLGHREVGFCQKILAFLNPLCDHIVDGGSAVLPLEGMGQVVLVHMSILCQLLQSQCFLEMQVDVPFDGSTLSVAGNHLRIHGNSEGSIAHEADNQNFHISLADIFISGILLFHLTQDISDTSGDLHTFKMIQNTELAVGVFTGGKLHTFDTKNNIFQRLCIQTDLSMGDIGVDDD